MTTLHGYVPFVVVTIPSPRLSSFMTYHRIVIKSNTTGARAGTGVGIA